MKFSTLLLLSIIVLVSSAITPSFRPALSEKKFSDVLGGRQTHPRQTPRGEQLLPLSDAIKIETSVLSTGAVKATIRIDEEKSKIYTKLETLIRILPMSAPRTCDPYSTALGELDIRDQLSVVNSATTGNWKLIAQKESTEKIYTTTLATTAIRQANNMANKNQNRRGGIISSAVSGGSSYAMLYACLYRVKEDGTSIELLDEEVSPFMVSDGPGSEPIDLYADIMKTEGNMIISMETRIDNYIERKQAFANGMLNMQMDNTVAKCQNCNADTTVTVTSFDSILCSMTVSTQKRGLYVQQCVQHWTIRLNKFTGRSADLLLIFAVRDQIRSTVFSVHSIIPTHDEQIRARKQQRSLKGAIVPLVGASVVSDGFKQTIATTTTKKRDEGDVKQKITFVDGRHTCIDLFVEGQTGVHVKVITAYLTTCRGSREMRCKNLSMVENGQIDNAFSRHAAGTLSIGKDDITHLCYKPAYSLNGKIYILWKTVDANEDAEAQLPQMRYLPYHLPPLEEWCIMMEIPCNGTLIIDPSILCAPDEHYDPALGECISHAQWDIAGGIITFVLVLLGLMILGGIIYVAYHGSKW